MPETQIKKIVESELQANDNTNSSNSKSQKPQKRQKKKRPFKKKVKIILRLIVVFALLLIASWKILTHSPQYKKLQSKTYDILAGMDKGTFRKGENTVFYDKDGNKIGEVDSGSYEYVEISKIPLDLQNAYIAAEDQQFKTHHGVNYFSTFRAGVEYLMHKDQITRGGSTITQQVIKNNLLTQEQTVTRKILELSLAPQLEKKYTKQDIMEFYCNSNYYGNGCYGVQSASRFYFGKDVSDLNTAECAMLAGISNSPNNYNPVANKDAAIRKEKIILKLMKECGMIKEEEYKTEKAREINVVGTEAEVQGINNYMCSYAMNCAVKHIMKEEGFEFKYLFDSDEECDQYWKDYQEKYNTISSEILAGGYKIYTSFDSNLQNQVQGIVDNTLSGYQDTVDGKYNQQAAVVTVDNDTGMITSIVGGRGTSDEFNRGFLAKRQPGSSIKPLLVYTPAFDKGIINPSSVLNDEKVYADDGNTSSFSPKNAYYGYKGAITARDALAMSTNTIAFKLLKDLGIDTGLNYLKKEYLRRIEKHYKALKKAYNKTWKTRIKEQQEENSKQQEADAMAKTEESNLAAEQSLHDWRIDNMNWYLKKLQEREYNTETAQLLITDAKNCLVNCEGYDEYNSLKKQLDAQVSRISSLPTEIPHGKSENDADETPDSSKYPDDTDISQGTSDPSQNDSNTEKEDQ